MTAPFRSAFATPVGMIDRIHRRPAYMRSPPQPTFAAGLTKSNTHVFRVSDLTNRGATGTGNTSNLAAGQIQLCPAGFPSDQCRGSPGTAAHRRAPARLHLDIVDRHAERD